MLAPVLVAADSDVRAALAKQFPGVKITSISPSPTVPGWLEVNTADRLVYATPDGRLLFVGNVIDLASKADLTGARWRELNPIDFQALPLNLAVTVRKGKGSRVVAVFSDPHCPYCQQLEKELAGLDDVTVHTFLFPLEAIHPGATETAKKIWCAKDRAGTWTRWMLEQKLEVTDAGCDTQGLTTVENLGRQLKVSATPTLFFSDGSRQDGAPDAKGLVDALTAAAARRKP